LNTTIEVKIVQRMHKELIATDVSVAKKKEEEDEKKERRVIKMIVLNGVFNFFLRSPDLLVWLQYTDIRNLIAGGSMTWEHAAILLPGFSNLIVDIGYFTYILTFSTNFLIFYKFNAKFKEAVIFIKTRLQNT
jgi:hypothetical protein